MSSVEMENRQSRLNGSSNSSAPAAAKTDSSTGLLQSCMEREPGIVLASDSGFFGPDKKHIITYDSTQMRT